MPQFGRPDNDNANPGGWTSTPLWEKIDEVVASTLDFIQSPNNPSNDVCRLGISAMVDPEVTTGHFVRFKVRKNNGGGRIIILSCRLKNDDGSVIRLQTFANLSENWQDIVWNLTTDQVNNIDDYALLQMEYDADVFGSGAGRRGLCAWMEMEVPNAPGGGRRIYVT